MSWNQPGPGRAGGRRLLRLGAALVAAVALGIGAYQFFLVPHAYSGSVERPEDYEAGCHGAGGRKYFPDADTYTADGGPHPIAIFLASEASEHRYALPGGATGPDKDAWDGNRQKGPRQVQLIACLSEPGSGEPIGTCEFSGAALALHRGLYDFTLYEAKTGDTVASGQISGTTKKSCPLRPESTRLSPILPLG